MYIKCMQLERDFDFWNRYQTFISGTCIQPSSIALHKNHAIIFKAYFTRKLLVQVTLDQSCKLHSDWVVT